MKRKRTSRAPRWEFDVVALQPRESGLVLALCVETGREPEIRLATILPAEGALTEAIRELARETGVRSATLVVRDDAVATALARLAPALHVVRENDLPTLDETAADLDDALLSVLPVIAMQAVLEPRPKLLAALFEAARFFYIAQPWHLLSDMEPLRISAGERTSYGLVTGSDEDVYGLALFESLPELGALLIGGSDDGPDVGWTSVTFSDESDVPEPLQELRRRHRLRIASRHAFPIAQRMGGRPPEVADVELLVDALLAVPRFVSRHAADLRQVGTAHGTETVRSGDGRTAQVTIEYPAALPTPRPPRGRGKAARKKSATAAVHVAPAPHESARAERDNRAVPAAGHAPAPTGDPPAELALHPRVLRLHVELAEIDPPIWRRIDVPADITLRTLHDILQLAMGWEDCHMHRFTIDGVGYGLGGNEYDEKEHDDAQVLLGDVAHDSGAVFIYEYDFGDGWEHRIAVEAIRRDVPPAAVPRLLDGARACPPEDCGGIPGYYELLEAIADPEHDEHTDMLEWVGGHYDPDEYDVADHDHALATMRPRDTDTRRTETGQRKGRTVTPASPATTPASPAEARAVKLAGMLARLQPQFRDFPPHVFDTAADLLLRRARTAPDAFLAVRKPGIWLAAALHAACMLQPQWAFLPLPHLTIEELAGIFGVSAASISNRSAELRRGPHR